MQRTRRFRKRSQWAQSFISKDDEITQIRERLAALEDDKARLPARLHELCAADSKNDVAPDPVAEAQEIVTQGLGCGREGGIVL